MIKRFFDSYAIIEYLNGNSRYSQYTLEEGITCFDNLMEVFYYLLKIRGLDIARQSLILLRKMIVDVHIDDIEPAMRFRYEHKGTSYIDVIGYTIAKRYKIPFLTGDIAFQNIPNVEFVK
ncbi:MAG: PIN domain-containing protein [Nanoarchaeota archaeon]